MSSNIAVQRVCEHCGQVFTARTTITRYCSHQCNRADYKAKQRAAKVEATEKATERKVSLPAVADLRHREFLTVPQVAQLLACSRRNVYNMINGGRLPATNLLERKTLVRRQDVEILTANPNASPSPRTEGTPNTTATTIPTYNLSDCYKLGEVLERYSLSASALQQLIKRNHIPKYRMGWHTYVPKPMIDALMN